MKIGFTPGCPGCKAVNRGLPAQNHTELFRYRVEEHVKVHGKERLDQAEERITHQLADRVEKLMARQEEKRVHVSTEPDQREKRKVEVESEWSSKK